MSKSRQKEEKLTMAQELERLLDEMDAENPGMSIRQAICQAVIKQAKEGNLRALQWLYTASGEERRETKRRNAETEPWQLDLDL